MFYYVKIPLRLPSLNEFIAKTKINNRNWNAGNELKRMVQSQIRYFLRDVPKITEPITINFTWHEKDKKRDPDNICFAKKFILDAMQEMKIIQNDNWRFVSGGFVDKFVCDGKYEIELFIKTNEGELKNDHYKRKRTVKAIPTENGKS